MSAFDEFARRAAEANEDADMDDEIRKIIAAHGNPGGDVPYTDGPTFNKEDLVAITVAVMAEIQARGEEDGPGVEDGNFTGEISRDAIEQLMVAYGFETSDLGYELMGILVNGVLSQFAEHDLVELDYEKAQIIGDILCTSQIAAFMFGYRVAAKRAEG